MDIPVAVLKIIKAADRRHPDSAQAALTWAVRRLRRHPDFEEFRDILFRAGVQHQINVRRTTSNAELKDYVHTPTTAPSPRFERAANSQLLREASAQMQMSLFNYRVGGRTLGTLKCSELLPLAAKYRQEAQGKHRVASVLERIASRNQSECTVADAVSESWLNRIWVELGVDSDAAAI